MRTVLACAALTAALLTAGAANAQSAPEVAWNIGFVSDYVFRGYSQTDEDPALQGGVDLTAGSFYAGAWASNVDFGDDTEAEVDLYGGFRTEAAGFALDFGAVGYFYVEAPDGADYDYVEFKAAASRAIGPVTAGAAVYYSPDFFGLDEEATYVEGNVAFAPADKWTVSAAVGYQALDVNDDYTTWNAGAAYALTDHLAIDVRYHDTDVDGPLSDERVVAGLKVTF
ncbi:TorF family putative porin [Brevundimonas sp.]|uniref:TorF family putative porin n=1 Tax=Brevundimonas sp. TaxID=1871086 RepID=UPI002737A787|nr:TorF family putative porin [Brevundimonas sp.]MDP3802956.1 TorF family putative porin [Brevundimonas sp.]